MSEIILFQSCLLSLSFIFLGSFHYQLMISFTKKPIATTQNTYFTTKDIFLVTLACKPVN